MSDEKKEYVWVAMYSHPYGVDSRVFRSEASAEAWKTEIAKQKVKDAIDKAKSNLPTDLTQQPNVQEFAFSEVPIMFVNVSGDYDGIKLKQYADKLDAMGRGVEQKRGSGAV